MLIFNNSTLINLCLQEIQFVVLRGGNVTYNGDPRVGKLTFGNLKMSNFPWVAQTPHSGANHWQVHKLETISDIAECNVQLWYVDFRAF